VVAGNSAIVTGNQFVDWSSGSLLVRADGECLVSDNQFTGTGVTCVGLNGNNIMVARNRATLSGGQFTTAMALGMKNVQLHGNQVALSRSATFGGWVPASTVPTGSLTDNVVTGGALFLSDVPAGLDFARNSLAIVGGRADSPSIPLEASSGHLLRLPVGRTSLGAGSAVKVDRAGNAVPLTAGETSFLGFSPANTGDKQSGVFIVGSSPGTIVPGVRTDGPWRAGNLGVPSPTKGGTIHDSGSQTPPSSGSYVMFLDSGTAEGLARVLVLKVY
jgi:hypothetical protein